MHLLASTLTIDSHAPWAGNGLLKLHHSLMGIVCDSGSIRDRVFSAASYILTCSIGNSAFKSRPRFCAAARLGNTIFIRPSTSKPNPSFTTRSARVTFRGCCISSGIVKGFFMAPPGSPWFKTFHSELQGCVRGCRAIERCELFQKICSNQIVRASASPNIELGSGGANQITVGIERVQEAGLVWASIWLNSRQRAFVYKKRSLYCAIVSPKSHSMSRGVI